VPFSYLIMSALTRESEELVDMNISRQLDSLINIASYTEPKRLCLLLALAFAKAFSFGKPFVEH